VRVRRIGAGDGADVAQKLLAAADVPPVLGRGGCDSRLDRGFRGVIRTKMSNATTVPAANVAAVAVNTIGWLSASDTTIVVPVYQILVRITPRKPRSSLLSHPPRLGRLA
jgi:hypothetical protein